MHVRCWKRPRGVKSVVGVRRSQARSGEVWGVSIGKKGWVRLFELELEAILMRREILLS